MANRAKDTFYIKQDESLSFYHFLIANKFHDKTKTNSA